MHPTGTSARVRSRTASTKCVRMRWCNSFVSAGGTRARAARAVSHHRSSSTPPSVMRSTCPGGNDRTPATSVAGLCTVPYRKKSATPSVASRRSTMPEASTARNSLATTTEEPTSAHITGFSPNRSRTTQSVRSADCHQASPHIPLNRCSASVPHRLSAARTTSVSLSDRNVQDPANSFRNSL